jgi:hypothetical protein
MEAIARPLACATSWRSQWRHRYDAPKAAGAQERPQRPQNPPTPTPDHVARAVVAVHLTLRHNGTGGGVTAMMPALAQQGREPVPARRTLYRIGRRHHTEGKERRSCAAMSYDL